MMLLVILPVLFLVTCAHRSLQVYAPSNAVITWARMSPPYWRTALRLSALTITMLVAMHLLAAVVAGGASGWLNLAVLVLAWDAIKFGVAAAVVGLRCSLQVCRWRWH